MKEGETNVRYRKDTRGSRYILFEINKQKKQKKQ